MSTNVLWESELGNFELILFDDCQLFIESTSGNICMLLLKPELKELYSALRDYFENKEDK